MNESSVSSVLTKLLTLWCYETAWCDVVVGALRAHLFAFSAIIIASLLAFTLTQRSIPGVAQKMLSRNIYGIDINKTTEEQRRAFDKKRRSGTLQEKELHRQAVPESLGILVGAVYLCTVILLTFVLNVDLSLMSAQLIATIVMLLLGFVDDVLDMSWRHKILLSIIGAFPLVLVYDGSRSVLIPPTATPLVARVIDTVWSMPARWSTNGWKHNGSSYANSYTNGNYGSDNSARMMGSLPYVHSGSYLLLNLGPLYLVYLALLSVFCTNSINILAGVNGVEVGQSMVIAIASVMYNVLQVVQTYRTGDVIRASADTQNVTTPPAVGAHAQTSSSHPVRALLLLGPFLGVSAALWRYNRYPARVFVGDSYTYFAGTVLVVASVSGVYSKTLMLFFLPQIFNFVISVPQLLHIVPCPRHRVPRWDAKRNVLSNSHNYTLLNVILWCFGDMHEQTLTYAVMLMQTLCCILAFIIRFYLSSFMYDRVE